MEVRERIMVIRERKGLSRPQLAKKMGTHRIRVWRLETGVYELSADDVEEFAKALGVTAGELYGEKPALRRNKAT